MSLRSRLPQRVLAGLVLLLGWGAGQAQTAVPRVLQVCATETPQVPVSLWQAAGMRPTADGGVDDFILSLVARRLQMPIVLTVAPSRRCVVGLQAGQFDGVLSLSETPERRVWGSYPMSQGNVDESLRYMRLGYHLYMRRGEGWRWDGQQLQGGAPSPVGMISGYSGVPFVRQRGLEVVETTAAPEALLRMLVAKRFALVALPESDATLVLARDAALHQAVVRLDPALIQRDYYLVLARSLVEKEPQLAARIWQGLARENESDWAKRARREAMP